MRTFEEFRTHTIFAIENRTAEAEGFKDEVKRLRKKKNEFLSPREKKIQKLKRSSSHWSGLR